MHGTSCMERHTREVSCPVARDGRARTVAHAAWPPGGLDAAVQQIRAGAVLCRGHVLFYHSCFGSSFPLRLTTFPRDSALSPLGEDWQRAPTMSGSPPQAEVVQSPDGRRVRAMCGHPVIAD